MTDFGGHVQVSLIPALSQNDEHRRGRSFSKDLKERKHVWNSPQSAPRKRPNNPNIFCLCKHMLSCSAYVGASCACSISSRSAKPQQMCFGKQLMFHEAGEGCAG